jgi:hypothetical protein
MHHYETLARRIVDEVETATAKVPVRWVTVQQIARRLGIHHSSAIAAVRLAVDRGWLIAEGSPPHSICRTRSRQAAMLSIDDTLSDLLYDEERMLQHEVEDLSPV